MERITREQLFDLVWAQPRSTLAKRFSLSDVAITKLCEKHRIPVPSRGHWARLEAGHKIDRPTLPLRLPGHSQHLEIGRESTQWRPPRSTDPVPDSPHFLEDIDAQVEQALKSLPKSAEQVLLANPHPGLRRILASEQRLKEKHKEHQWSFYEPRFNDPRSQKKLKLLNRLCHSLAAVGSICQGQITNNWTQGVGTRYELELRIVVGRVGGIFRFDDEGAPSSARRKRKIAGASEPLRLALQIGREPARTVWEETDASALDAPIRAIVKQVLRCSEVLLRKDASERYAEVVEAIAKAKVEEEAAAARRQREELERLAAIEKKKRGDLIDEAADWETAVRIRAYVSHIDAQGGNDLTWRQWALGVADEKDPTESRLHGTDER